MKKFSIPIAFVFGALSFGDPSFAITTFQETEVNDTQANANFVGPHDGSIDIFGYQDSSFDVFSFYGTAGDKITLEVQDEGPNPNYSPFYYDFDSWMTLYSPAGYSWYDDDDDNNFDEFGNDLPQRVRDKKGSYISQTLTETGLYYVRLENFCFCDYETYDYKLVIRGLTPTLPQPGAVPLPAGIPLALTGIGLLFGLCRWRRNPA